MILKITEEQSAKVNSMIQRLCCDYNDGNCLLLDDGEPCRCVQELSCYGIYCNYFGRAVITNRKTTVRRNLKPKQI